MRVHLSPKHGINPAIPKCYLCLEDKNEIVLFGRLRGDAEAPHGQVHNDDPCDKCGELMQQGVILISIKDGEDQELEAAQQEARLPNPYRTGGWCVVRDEAITRMIQPPFLSQQILKKRVCFVPDQVWDTLGLPRGEVAPSEVICQ